MQIIELDLAQAERIRPLWQGLNARHLERSTHFRQHFATFTFGKRLALLAEREQAAILIAEEENTPVAYCLVSASGSSGEIDSLYVAPAHRRAGIGRRLVEEALKWLTAKGCTEIRLAIAEGNEETLPFYERQGFRKRFLVLQYQPEPAASGKSGEPQ